MGHSGRPRVAIAASGGGHTGYAVAIAQRLRGWAEILYVADPADKWTHERLNQEHPGAPVLPLPRLRGPGEPLAEKLLSHGASTAAAVLRLARRLRGLHVDALICTGSNHSLLAALAAHLAGTERIYCIEAIDRIATRSKTPAIIHDLGLGTILLHWPQQRRHYPRGLVVGPIVPKPSRPPTPPPPRGHILVLTGTVGNPRLIRLLLKTRLDNVVVQTGRLTPPELVEKARPGWRALRYTPDPAPLIQGARLVLSHQGLGLAEAALAHRRPVLLAYNPDLHMTSGWQDAVELARFLGTEALDPSRAAPQDLEKAIREAADRRPPRYPDGAETVARLILEDIA